MNLTAKRLEEIKDYAAKSYGIITIKHATELIAGVEETVALLRCWGSVSDEGGRCLVVFSNRPDLWCAPCRFLDGWRKE